MTEAEEYNILIGVTGSVATIKLGKLCESLLATFGNTRINIEVVATTHSKHFFKLSELPIKVKVHYDQEEWDTWKDRGDPVLHIELGKWANLFLIAPLDANTLAKISTGICDNLLTSAVRAWDINSPLIFCPAMNTKMYNHPITKTQIEHLKGWGYKCVPVVEKTLVCGDTGVGAMAEVDTIVEYVKKCLENVDLIDF